MYSLYLITVFILGATSFSVFVDNNYAEDYCSDNKCIYKCCGRNEYMNDTQIGVCVGTDKTLDYNIQLYDEVEHDKLSDVNFKDVFKLRLDKMRNETFAQLSFNPELAFMKTYLSESGILYLELANAYHRWTPIADFCVEYVEIDSEFLINYWVIFDDARPEKDSVYTIALLLSSCFFLTLLLIVYAILPELRNIGGMVLMAYVFSLLGAFASLAAMKIDAYEKDTCIALTTIIYFFFLAAFSWMNVMSIDIWWTFRGYAKARPIHRKGETFKFCMYCLYAWGVPLLMAVAFVLINNADLSDMPWIIQPCVPKFGCFIDDGEKLVYLYLPMLILIVCNWIFYLMTAFNVWRLSRGTAVLNSPAAGNPASHRSQKQRFSVYLKLSVIMGINWILEVISFFLPDLSIWYITDTYNLLIGFTIFLIFIWKDSVYNKLMTRYKCFKRIRYPKRSMTASVTMESHLSQDTPSGCPDPKYRERKISTVSRSNFSV